MCPGVFISFNLQSNIMGRKLSVSDTRKKFIKENFSETLGKQLTGDEKLYFSKVKGGKQRYKEAIKIDGKIIPKETEEMIKTFAANNDITVKQYVDKFETEIKSYIETNSVTLYKRDNNLSEMMIEGNFKTVTIGRLDDEGELVNRRMSKADAILELETFRQYVKLNSNIVDISFRTDIALSGRVSFAFPSPEEYEGLTGEELVELIDSYGDDLIYFQS